jgi:hypothetical protein
MSSPMQPSNLVRVLAALLLGLLAWQGKNLCAKVDKLDERLDGVEKRQIAIGTRLGLPPEAAVIPGNPGVFAGLGPVPENQTNQKSVLCP